MKNKFICKEEEILCNEFDRLYALAETHREPDPIYPGRKIFKSPEDEKIAIELSDQCFIINRKIFLLRGQYELKKLENCGCKDYKKIAKLKDKLASVGKMI